MVDIAALTMLALVALGVTYALGVRRGRALAQTERPMVPIPAREDVHAGRHPRSG